MVRLPSDGHEELERSRCAETDVDDEEEESDGNDCVISSTHIAQHMQARANEVTVMLLQLLLLLPFRRTIILCVQ